MNKLLLNLCFAFALVCFTSCSSDDMQDTNNSIFIGVWDYVEIEADETRTFRLVFQKDFNGLEINSVDHNTDGITSSAVPMVWSENKDTIEVNGDSKEVYELNSEGQLVSSSNQEIVLDKISDVYPI